MSEERGNTPKTDSRGDDGFRVGRMILGKEEDIADTDSHEPTHSESDISLGRMGELSQMPRRRCPLSTLCLMVNLQGVTLPGCQFLRSKSKGAQWIAKPDVGESRMGGAKV